MKIFVFLVFLGVFATSCSSDSDDPSGPVAIQDADKDGFADDVDICKNIAGSFNGCPKLEAGTVTNAMQVVSDDFVLEYTQAQGGSGAYAYLVTVSPKESGTQDLFDRGSALNFPFTELSKGTLYEVLVTAFDDKTSQEVDYASFEVYISNAVTTTIIVSPTIVNINGGTMKSSSQGQLVIEHPLGEDDVVFDLVVDGEVVVENHASKTFDLSSYSGQSVSLYVIAKEKTNSNIFASSQRYKVRL